MPADWLGAGAAAHEPGLQRRLRPRWSPDGRLLAFTSRRPVNEAERPDERAPIWFLRMDRPAARRFRSRASAARRSSAPTTGGSRSPRPCRRPRPRPAAAKTAFEKLTEERFKGRIYDWMNARFDGRGYLPDPARPVRHAAERAVRRLARRRHSAAAHHAGCERRRRRRGGRQPRHSCSRRTCSIVTSTPTSARTSSRWISTVDATRVTNDGFDHESPTFAADGSILAFRQQSLNQVTRPPSRPSAPPPTCIASRRAAARRSTSRRRGTSSRTRLASPPKAASSSSPPAAAATRICSACRSPAEPSSR